MKKINVVVGKYESAYFPIIARWVIGSGSYSAVFSTMQDCTNYFVGRFGGNFRFTEGR